MDSDKLIREARVYHDEFQEQGAISDHPEFDDWYKHADAFANITKMTPDEYRRMRAEPIGPRRALAARLRSQGFPTLYP